MVSEVCYLRREYGCSSRRKWFVRDTEISKPSLSIPVESNDDSETSSGEKNEIAVSDIVANPFQPRKSMDSSAVDGASKYKGGGSNTTVVVQRLELVRTGSGRKALEGTPKVGG